MKRYEEDPILGKLAKKLLSIEQKARSTLPADEMASIEEMAIDGYELQPLGRVQKRLVTVREGGAQGLGRVSFTPRAPPD